MQIKSQLYTFSGANQDINKEHHSFKFYYDAQHIRILATDSQSTGAITNEKGNELVVTVPDITIDKNKYRINYSDGGHLIYKEYVNGKATEISKFTPASIKDNTIIGHTTTREGIVLFCNSGTNDSIWYIKFAARDNYDIKLVYLGKLGFSKNNPIQAIFNYENEKIQKVYWVDGLNQTRFINLENASIEGNTDTINLPKDSLNFVGEINLSQPYIRSKSSGGTHTAGMIQYAYNLYRQNGAQTAVSPFSELVDLDKGDGVGGGEVNEVVGTAPVIKIDNIDTNYDSIKIYSIKYTSFGQLPKVSLIEERRINASSLLYSDTGKVIETLTLEELLFLGGDLKVAKHIESKDNRLILGNIKEYNFSMPEELDFRSYSYDRYGNNPRILNEVTGYNNSNGNATGEGALTVNNYDDVPYDHSSININYDTFRYTNNGSVVGGSGKYIDYAISNVFDSDLGSGDKLMKASKLRKFKDGDIYRIAIQFYNALGQTSVPYWIADFKAPVSNLENLNEGKHEVLKVTIRPALRQFINSYDWGSDYNRPVGFRILRANRTDADKTIIEEGVLSNMVYQIKDQAEAAKKDNADKNRYQDTETKVPSWLIRHIKDFPQNFQGDHNGGILMGNKHNERLWSEVYGINNDSSSKITNQTYIYDKLIQMYTPELLLDSKNYESGLVFSLKGCFSLEEAASWSRAVNTVTQKTDGEFKSRDTINWTTLFSDTPYYKFGEYVIDNNSKDVNRMSAAGSVKGKIGFIVQSNIKDTMLQRQYYRKYKKFTPNNQFGGGSSNVYNLIYGAPEYTVKGASNRFYNNNSKMGYSNSLKSIIGSVNNDDEGIVSVNSYGNSCVTFALGQASDNTNNRTGLFEIGSAMEFQTSNFKGKNPADILIGTIRRHPSYIYLGGLYGGNSYENKKRSEYVEIGDYVQMDDSNAYIETIIHSPGDVFVQNFKLLRICKTDEEVYDKLVEQITEVIEFPIETTVDLENRNDISFSGWDGKFQPRDDEFFKYNKVYSQESNLIRNRDLEYNFNEIQNFDTRITTTKKKIPNESIDSWTDILINEELDLNGKYGPINALASFKDNIFAFQDKAVAGIQINPRVQIPTEDGVGLELGTGGILADFKYLSTTSGTLNKWSVLEGKRGLYYYDTLNKCVCRYPDMIESNLSDTKGFHTWFNNNYNYKDLVIDNPVTGKGALIGKDPNNADIYITLLQGDKSFTRVYNEYVDAFIDKKVENPNRYIALNDKLLSTIYAKTLFEHGIGEYNRFYNKKANSHITLLLNPDANISKVFNNIQYNSEVYLNDLDQSSQSLTHIRGWNEYQDTGKIPLVVSKNSNLARTFRTWKADIPRDGRNRLRNPWIFLRLYFDNTKNYKLILHDIIVKYSI